MDSLEKHLKRKRSDVDQRKYLEETKYKMWPCFRKFTEMLENREPLAALEYQSFQLYHYFLTKRSNALQEEDVQEKEELF